MKNSKAAAWIKYALKRLQPVRPPNAVEIETDSHCNRKCVYCPNFTVGRPEEKMPDALYYKIIDSLAKWGFAGRLSPHFYGEPLADDRLAGFMKYAREKLPRAQIIVYTNGDFLTVEKYYALLDAGVDSFRISQHSPTLPKVPSETLEHVKKHTPELFNVAMVDFYALYQKKDEGMLNNRGGLIDIKRKRSPSCYYVANMTIDCKGDVLLCCNDYAGEVSFGNAGEREVRDIWRSSKYVNARAKAASGIWDYDLCKRCNL
ncbi:MAG: radical SAM/SPASM domain-containing protein [Nitrospinae bacterium]|nr:radical SAM/SPASM domain-containing protein [Nitrospinota bacterium]